LKKTGPAGWVASVKHKTFMFHRKQGTSMSELNSEHRTRKNHKMQARQQTKQWNVQGNATKSPGLHCKLHVIRTGKDYGLQQEYFRNTVHWFGDSRVSFAIGSGVQDAVYIPRLMSGHFTLHLDKEKLIATPHGEVRIKVGERQAEPLSQERSFDLELAAEPFRCTALFPNQTAVAVKVWQEEFFLPDKSRLYLEKQYGTLQKIDEGKSSLIFATSDHCVVKVLRPAYSDNPKVVTRFTNAANKCQGLPAPLFIKIHEVAYRPEYHLCYVVLDKFDGESLENYVGRKGILPLTEAEKIVGQIAQRLLLLQQNGYVYRNLSPANILYRQDGEIAITGFFLLKSDIPITAEDAQMVIQGYTAPEQAHHPAEADIAADMFSLGAIFHTLLLGEPPLRTNSLAQYIELLKSGQPTEARQLRHSAPFLPVSTCNMIASMLSFDKNRRPAPQHILDELSQLPNRMSMVENDDQTMPNQEDAAATHDNGAEDALSNSLVILLEKVDHVLQQPENSSEEDKHSEASVVLPVKPASAPATPAFSVPVTDKAISAVAVPVSALQDVRQKLQEVYQQCDAPAVAKSKKQERLRPQASYGKNKIAPIVLGGGCFILLLFVVATLRLAFSWVWSGGVSHTADKPSTEQTTPPPLTPDRQQPQAVPPKTATTPAAFVVQGKIERLYKYSGQLQYFTVEASDQCHAVVVPAQNINSLLAIIEQAYQNQMRVEITGKEETLAHGVLLVKGNRIKRYIQLSHMRVMKGQ
jgi:serine/threonine protein kinase